MPYSAKVYKVMIASPGDVERERRAAREIIQEWNNVHSEDRGIVLMPVGWDTHSSPSMEGTAQYVINKQVLQDCDLLIAIFWTRIGTPTGKAESGTIEEIEEHLAAGKPAMIYFSSVPVVLDSVDQDQYSRLKKFKEDFEKRGLVETFDSHSEFRSKLSRQIAQTVLRQFTPNKDQKASAEVNVVTPQLPSISDDAAELLMAAAHESNGTIIAVRSAAGLSVQAGNRQFVEERNPRSEARWHKALEILQETGLIRDIGYQGEVFEVTADGYEVADSIAENR